LHHAIITLPKLKTSGRPEPVAHAARRSAQAILAVLLATATETRRAGFFSSSALIHLALTGPFSRA
jgi:hypothetical protein